MRSLFDKLIEQYPDSKDYLCANADVVHSSHFTSAVIKVQALDERSLLNSNGTKAIKRFLIAPKDQDVASESDSEMIIRMVTGRKISLMIL